MILNFYKTYILYIYIYNEYAIFVVENTGLPFQGTKTCFCMAARPFSLDTRQVRICTEGRVTAWHAQPQGSGQKAERTWSGSWEMKRIADKWSWSEWQAQVPYACTLWLRLFAIFSSVCGRSHATIDLQSSSNFNMFLEFILYTPHTLSEQALHISSLAITPLFKAPDSISRVSTHNILDTTRNDSSSFNFKACNNISLSVVAFTSAAATLSNTARTSNTTSISKEFWPLSWRSTIFGSTLAACENFGHGWIDVAGKSYEV